MYKCTVPPPTLFSSVICYPLVMFLDWVFSLHLTIRHLYFNIPIYPNIPFLSYYSTLYLSEIHTIAMCTELLYNLLRCQVPESFRISCVRSQFISNESVSTRSQPGYIQLPVVLISYHNSLGNNATLSSFLKAHSMWYQAR